MTRTSDAASEGWVDLPILDGHYVYALYGAESKHVPLYVGQSVGVVSRIGSHLANPEKRSLITRASVRRCQTKVAMSNTELALIRAFCPPWNNDGLPSSMLRVDYSGDGHAPYQAAAWHRYLTTAWLTTEQVAERIDSSVAEVNRFVAEGALRSAADQHGKRRFRPTWVADLLLARFDLLPQPHLFSLGMLKLQKRRTPRGPNRLRIASAPVDVAEQVPA